jgi:hypothetical protein
VLAGPEKDVGDDMSVGYTSKLNVFFMVARFKDDPQVDSLCIPGGFFAEVRKFFLFFVKFFFAWFVSIF